MPRRAIAVFLLLLGLSCAPALAQDFPTRPITIVVPYASGSVPDLVARLVAEKLSPALKQAVRVEVRPGSSGNIGAASVAQSAPDGHMLLFAESSLLTINPYIYRKLPFHAERDFVPIAPIGESVLFLVINAAVPVSSLPEFVEYARFSTTILAYASSGSGSLPHIAIERLSKAARLEMLHVPYRGLPQATAAVVSGEVAFGMTGRQGLGFLQSGRLKALAVSSVARSKARMEVPGIGEYFPGLESTNWQGLFAPAGTPTFVLERLEFEVARALAMPEMRRRLAGAFDLQPLSLTRIQFSNLLRTEREHLRPEWEHLGITIE